MLSGMKLYITEIFTTGKINRVFRSLPRPEVTP